jgi:tetratricopeptide (TPR) repeat protein
MEGLGLFYEWRVRYAEGKAIFQAAAEGLKGLPQASVGHLLACAKAMAWQSLFSLNLGRTETARELLRQGMHLLEDAELAAPAMDTRRERALLLRRLGQIEHRAGDNQKAEGPYRQSLALYRALGARWETASVLDEFSWVVGFIGDFDQGERLDQEALGLHRTLGDQRGIAHSLRNVATNLTSRGQYKEAERLHRESLDLCREMGDRVEIWYGLYWLAVTLNFRGEFAESRSLLEDGLAIGSDLALHAELLPFSHIVLGIVKLHLGQYREARVHLRQGLALAQEIDVQAALVWAYWGLGNVAIADEMYTEAQRWFQESLTVLQESGNRGHLGRVLSSLGDAVRGLGHRSRAREHLSAALRASVDYQVVHGSLWVLSAAARFLVDVGKIERAIEVYALASRYPLVANSRWFEDVAGRHVAAAAAGLPLDVVAAAQERGWVRDLWTTIKELLVDLESVKDNQDPHPAQPCGCPGGGQGQKEQAN